MGNWNQKLRLVKCRDDFNSIKKSMETTEVGMNSDSYYLKYWTLFKAEFKNLHKKCRYMYTQCI